MEDVYAVIDGQFREADSGIIPYTQISSRISNALNNKWESAWNVFVFKNSNREYNAVFVGYAFRDHWLWNNDYHNHYTIIVWKDYNCGTWVNVNLSPSNFNNGFNKLPSYANEYLNLNNI